MAAYASTQRDSAVREYPSAPNVPQMPALTSVHQTPASVPHQSYSDVRGGAEVIEELLDRIADRIAAAIAERLTTQNSGDDEWFDSRHAAEYLRIHRDTLRTLAAQRAIPCEQDGPGCKLFFRRSDLDAWRRTGGRPHHLGSSLAVAA
jgi:excisionase family DNA binding protein